MKVKFNYQEPADNGKVYIEQVFAEKSGGGVVANQKFDVEPTTAVGMKDGMLHPIKAYRLVKQVTSGDASIEIAKGSGVVAGDVISDGKVAVEVTSVAEKADKDVVKVTMGVEIPNGKVLYQAKAAGNIEPIVSPEYVTGAWCEANKGDQAVRLINGANLRKETANIAKEVADMMPTIQLI